LSEEIAFEIKSTSPEKHKEKENQLHLAMIGERKSAWWDNF
jgi:hypothetical protein